MSIKRLNWDKPSVSTIQGTPHYDLTEKFNHYTGNGKILRLNHIAVSSYELYLDAISLAFQYAKSSSKNIHLAKSIARALNLQGIAVPEGTEWIAEKEATLIAEREALKQSVEGSSWNWNYEKSNVSTAFKNLAFLLYEMGDFRGAKVNIVKFRDTASSKNYEDVMESLIFEATVDFFSLKNDNSSLTFSSKLTSLFLDTNDSLSWPGAVKVGVLCGIATLQQEKYREAASVLLKISPTHSSIFSDVATPEDLALYITLAALASFSRVELQFLSSADQVFQSLSEDSPQNLPGLIELFLNSKYKEFFSSLEAFKPDYQADPFLFPILKNLLCAIMKRALLQYLSVYKNVSIQTVSEIFLLKPSQLEELIKIYITEGTINVLIDQRHGMLFCREVDESYEKLVSATTVADNYLNGCRVMLNTLV